jgi:hypothetical protein
MLQRTGKRLLDLHRNGRVRVVRQPVVLAGAKGEFGLQEELIPGDYATFNYCRDGLTNGCFVVVRR